jgi:medium-chain acyl-[acyl-carrier-protein] hydrolase
VAYHLWPGEFPPDVELCAVQLPGRGKRRSELPFTRMLPLLEALDAGLAPFFDVPFVFFGHSMGALIAFELTRCLRRRGAPMPLHLFVSARQAPQIPSTEPPLHHLPEPALLAELRRYGGTPESILEEPYVMSSVLPLIRADFEILETWSHVPEAPLPVPITAFGGLDDVRKPRARLEAWRVQTCSRFALHMVPGDHFFIHSAPPLLFALISKALLC